MGEYVNPRGRRLFYDDPDGITRRVAPGEVVELDDETAEAAGLVETGSEEGEAAINMHRVGDAAFPVQPGENSPEGSLAERSGLHLTGADSGVPVASEAEAEVGDRKDGSGEDPFESVVAVEQGEVARGEVTSASAPGRVNPDEHTKDELVEMAEAAGVDSSGTKQEIADRISEASSSGALTSEDVPRAT
jgi:hypothetical protein